MRFLNHGVHGVHGEKPRLSLRDMLHPMGEMIESHGALIFAVPAVCAVVSCFFQANPKRDAS